MFKHRNSIRNKTGFTIVELVIVIAVVAILAAVLIPTFSGIIEKGKYSNAFQNAENMLKADALSYTSRNGGKVPDGTVYESGGYCFKVLDNQLVRISRDEYEQLHVVDFTRYKNIIFLIADGGGYDNLTLTDKVKTALVSDSRYSSYNNKLSGAMTTATTDTIGGESHTGTYLLDYLVGSANTMLPTTHSAVSYTDGKNNHKAYITDSSAAGTALSSGYKTTYCYSGIDSDKKPGASLSEVAKIAGKSVGIVSTKSFADATPLAFLTSHSIYRYEYSDNAIQAVLADADVVIFEGTYYGDLYQTTEISNSAHSIDIVLNQGYELIGGAESASLIGVNADRALLNEIISGSRPSTKLWAPMLGVTNSGTHNLASYDTAADLIAYDVYGGDSNPLIANQPSILEMAQAALKVLENGNNDNGFFLMIEGGAIDNAAEGVNFREFVGDYLAFDETFAYCVQWAKSHGDETLVIACPDHDSGGFYGIEPFEDELIDAIITGTLKAKEGSSGTDQTPGKTPGFKVWRNLIGYAGYDNSQFNYHSSHTDMCVPISLYAPSGCKSELLAALGLPENGDESTIRQGTSQYYVPNANEDELGIPIANSDGIPQYRSSALNSAYIIENTDIAPVVAKYAGFRNLREVSAELYVPVGHFDGTSVTANSFGSITFTHSESYVTNSYNTYYGMDFSIGGISGSRNSFIYNTSSRYTKIGRLQPRAVYVLDEKTKDAADKHSAAKQGTLFLPQSVLVENGLAYAVHFTNNRGEALEPLTIPVGSTTFTLPTHAVSDHWNRTGKAIKAFTINGVTYQPGATVNNSDVFTGGTRSIEVFFTVK